MRGLQASGVTIILTTHYIEEAEEMADRVGVISKGEIILVEDKKALMSKLGQKRLTLSLDAPMSQIPAALAAYPLKLSAAGSELIYSFGAGGGSGVVTALLRDLVDAGVSFKDVHTEQSSLEDIFVDLVREAP